jgi:hypothetical protein
MEMTLTDRRELARAQQILDYPGFGMRMLNVIGTPIERILDFLPRQMSEGIATSARVALEKGMQTALLTLDESQRHKPPSNRFHKRMAIASGGIGGFLGLPGLAMELPISTVLMFRSISEIARSFGEDIREPDTMLNCMQVFALGGRSEDDDALESAYFATRIGLAQVTARAADYIQKQAARELGKQAIRITAPALTRFTHQVGARFSVAVSEKVAAMGLPVVGAVGGAAINSIFMDHFQQVAWAHFLVRHLERKYSDEDVRAAWAQGTAADLRTDPATEPRKE